MTDVDWPAALAAVEAALVATGLGKPAVTTLDADVELAARCAIAAKFLAVATPRSFAAINLGARAPRFVAAQSAWAAPREVLTWDAAAGGSPRDLATALAADIVIAAGPLAVPRAAIRGGTHLVALDPGVALAAELVAGAEVYDVPRLAAVVAGLVDGRQLDEITLVVNAG
jgi:hypothetical protein